MTRVDLSDAISILVEGQIVAVPTETVYGLAACLNQTAAIEKIFSLKKRPKANPLIIHVANWQEILHFVNEFPPDFKALAETFWPGPMTCILPVNPLSVPHIARSGLPTAGFRVPSHSMTRELIEKIGPLVMPSANLSGRPSATSRAHVEEDFGLDFPVLDGGPCSKGLESTILLYDEGKWSIARLGALPGDAFFPLLGYEPLFLEKSKDEKPSCPGQLFRHYAPQARLILEDNESLSVLEKIPFVLGFKERVYPPDKRIILLGSLLNPEEVAENLYGALRLLDQEKAPSAWVDMNFPKSGLWMTIYERLRRAGEN